MAFGRNIYPTSFDRVNSLLHPDHESRNTRVSEYLRKYGQGKIDTLPTDNRPVVTDNRSVDEMLDNPNKVADSLGSEQLDVLLEMQNKQSDYEQALKDIELTKKQRESYDAAIKVLNDSNASYDQKMDAHRILEELIQAKKVTRVRK